MRGFESVEQLQAALARERYLVDAGLATVVFLGLRLRRPLLVEGEPGVGKTELAKALAGSLSVPLVRLQCYEGIDVHHALYDWDYPRQLLSLRAGTSRPLYSEEFLVRRPLLQVLERPDAVLLIDELDRADDEFEAFLLEFLSDFQVTVPEIGVIKAESPPAVVITSNRTREIHDALKRRCLYHWVGYPSADRELKIVRAKVPGIARALSEQVVHFVQALRKEDLFKSPGVAETLDWASALAELDVVALDPTTVCDTRGVLLKYQDDIARLEGGKAKELIEGVRAQLRAAE